MKICCLRRLPGGCRELKTLCKRVPDSGDAHLWQLLKAQPRSVLVTGDRTVLEYSPEIVAILSPATFCQQLGLGCQRCLDPMSSLEGGLQGALPRNESTVIPAGCRRTGGSVSLFQPPLVPPGTRSPLPSPSVRDHFERALTSAFFLCSGAQCSCLTWLQWFNECFFLLLKSRAGKSSAFPPARRFAAAPIEIIPIPSRSDSSSWVLPQERQVTICMDPLGHGCFSYIRQDSQERNREHDEPTVELSEWL